MPLGREPREVGHRPLGHAPTLSVVHPSAVWENCPRRRTATGAVLPSQPRTAKTTVARAQLTKGRCSRARLVGESTYVQTWPASGKDLTSGPGGGRIGPHP